MDIFDTFDLGKIGEKGEAYTPYGIENVGLIVVGVEKDRITRDNMVVTASSVSFFTGILGLSNANLVYNHGTFRPTPLVGNLKYPRNCFSYTAGSYGRHWFPPSLVFGGYDRYRVDPETTLEVDIRRTTSALESSWWQFEVIMTSFDIEMTGIAEKQPMSPELTGISVYLDPSTPYLWLPTWICERFEAVLGIEWNETQQLYLLNASNHEQLRRLNPRVSFGLSSLRGDGQNKSFELPYSAFDLNVTYPLVESQSYYFPLKRVMRTNHYVLGRTFFQEAHISVDWDLGYFNISQAKFSTNSHLVPARKGSISTDSSRYTGIGIGSLLGLLAFFLVVVGFYWKLKFNPSLHREPKEQFEDKAQLHGVAIPWVELLPKERMELEAKEGIVEVTGSRLEGVVLHEMDAASVPICKS